MSSMTPGEDDAFEAPRPGAPLSEEEGLRVARRLGRGEQQTPREPEPDIPIDLAYRVTPQVLLDVRARAAIEGVTAEDVFRAALGAYATGAPGTATTFTPEQHA